MTADHGVQKNVIESSSIAIFSRSIDRKSNEKQSTMGTDVWNYSETEHTTSQDARKDRGQIQ